MSNVAPDVSASKLASFICAKLKTSHEQVSVTPLVARSIRPEEIRFLQFRVSVTPGLYNFVSSPTFWPSGVRTRDFIVKRNNRHSNRQVQTPVSSNRFDVTVPDGQCPVQEVHSTANDSDNRNEIVIAENMAIDDDFLSLQTTMAEYASSMANTD